MEHFSTLGVREADQIGRWNQIVGQNFRGGAVEARREDFAAEFWRWTAGPIRLMRAKAQRSTVTRWRQLHAGEADSGRLILHLQHRGASQTAQFSRAAVLSAGDLTLCDGAIPYMIDISDGNDLLVLDIPQSGLSDPAKAAGLAARRFSGAHPHVAVLRRFTLSLWDEFRASVPTADDASALGRVILDLAALALSPDSMTPASDPAGTRDRILSWIQDRLTDPALSTSMIASALDCPVRTVQTIFARMGTTPTQYILRHRLERARAMLIERGDMSITDIAFELGFNDSSYFSRAFRKRFNLTPRLVRAGHIKKTFA